MTNTIIKEGHKLLNNFVLEMLIVLLLHDTVTDAKRCMRNDDIGWRPGNIYTCDEPMLTECCERFSVFTCCESNDQKNVHEHLQLWGSVCLFVIMLTIVYFLLRRDLQVFSRPTMKGSFQTMKGHFRLGKINAASFSGVARQPSDNSGIKPSSMKRQNLFV